MTPTGSTASEAALPQLSMPRAPRWMKHRVTSRPGESWKLLQRYLALDGRNASTISYSSPELAAELELPKITDSSFQNQDDAVLTARLPREMLRQSPGMSSKLIQGFYPSLHTETESRQLRYISSSRADCLILYRCIVPPSGRILRFRSLAFIGMHRSIHTVTVAQAQAL